MAAAAASIVIAGQASAATLRYDLHVLDFAETRTFQLWDVTGGSTTFTEAYSRDQLLSPPTAMTFANGYIPLSFSINDDFLPQDYAGGSFHYSRSSVNSAFEFADGSVVKISTLDDAWLTGLRTDYPRWNYSFSFGADKSITKFGVSVDHDGEFSVFGSDYLTYGLNRNGPIPTGGITYTVDGVAYPGLSNLSIKYDGLQLGFSVTSVPLPASFLLLLSGVLGLSLKGRLVKARI